MPTKISSLEFGVLSPDLIRSIATVRIVTSDLYDADGYPVDGGVMDPRLGVIDPGLRCRTCAGNIGECPGHFGYLELARPIINTIYIKFIYLLLKYSCKKCGRVMTKKELEKSKGKNCPFCGSPLSKVSFVKPYTYYEEKEELNPMQIREWFEKIPSEDLKKIGFNGGRAEWMILTLFPIPPVTIRPSITLEGGERSEDDLTHKLVDIVRINQSLKENIDIGAPEFILNDLWELLQYHIATYFDNELTGIPQARHRSGRPLKGIMQRLKAKEGRIRGNLLGKRVNYSSRTVISPDPRLSINEVGVPEVVAKELTVPEFVTNMNINYIKKLINDDKVNYITRPDGRKIKVGKENKKDLISNIATGWSADRQLKDGDIVLFNRQPSLHRISVMAHRVKVMPYRTFRMNPSVCPPYNADFDGDEMNLHALQTMEAKVESSLLMEVQNNIISPKFGGPIIGLDLDQISGIYLLTQKDTILTKEEVAQILGSAGIDVDLPDKEKFYGREVVSLLLPKRLNLEYEKAGKKIIIKNGELLEGCLDANAVGAFKGKIISKIRRLESNQVVRDFIDNTGRLGVAYLMKRGFSIGLSDLDLPPRIRIEIHAEIQKAERNSNKLIDDYNHGRLKALPGMTIKESLEAQILNVLATGLNKISEIVMKNIKHSDILVMSEAGAKGSNINTTQMAACVGSETVLGKRIESGYLDRTLPHFKVGDLSAIAHGFVARGFKQGLTAFEFFWNIMNGREGLMDKSLRTRKSGYMQRRLVNALQDLKVYPDYTVRGAEGEIIQFVAGEDKIDPTKSDWGELDWKTHIKG
jgi:DNA-directed RNA polymerase subunit A'